MSSRDISLSSYSRKFKYILWFLPLISALSGLAQSAVIRDSVAIFACQGNPAETVKRIQLTPVHYIKATDNRINFGVTGSEFHYVLLKLNSANAGITQYLSIDNTSLDTISIYRVYKDGTSRLLYLGGSLVAFQRNRNYVWHTAPLEIDEAESFYLIAMKASQKNINVRYEILDKDVLQSKYERYERFVFFYCGVIFMITAITALAFVLFKKVVFAAYLGYITGASGWIFCHYGRAFPFLYPELPIINEIAKPVSSLTGSLFLILVLYLIFRQQLKLTPWLQRLLVIMLYILVLLTGSMFLLLIPSLNLSVKFALMICWHVGLLTSASVIMCTPLVLIRYNATAKIFSAAMAVIGMMAIGQLVGNLGYITNYSVNEHGMAVGSLLEISIMAFGLFYNLLEEQKERERQVLALEQAQTATLKKLITVQEDERKRIAGDLHDNIGPLLAALKINFRRIIHTKDTEVQNGLAVKTESIIDDSIAEIRNVAHNLMPKGLSSNGLINTLKEYFDGIQSLYNKTVEYEHHVESSLDQELQVNIYRIICELVLNAARHSNARLITIHIKAIENKVSISIKDNGSGFSVIACNEKKSFGLQSAEGRVQYLKGTYSLTSEPGCGTNIHIEIPLQLYNAQVNGL
jgi:signal transduction histidine kinase